MNQELKKTLWAAADKLRSSMDAAEYKHLVLGLIFLKYISDAFDERRQTLAKEFQNPKSDLFAGDADAVTQLLEDKDYYSEVHVFWVPAPARWETLRSAAKQPDIGKRIDDALIAIELANPELKKTGLDKRFARTQLEPGKLGELIDLISTIGFGEGGDAKDDLGVDREIQGARHARHRDVRHVVLGHDVPFADSIGPPDAARGANLGRFRIPRSGEHEDILGSGPGHGHG